MQQQDEINQPFEDAYADGVKRITAMDHGLTDKSLAWVLDREYALNAYHSPILKMFRKTLLDYLLVTLRREQYATHQFASLETTAPANPYYPNDKSNRVGD